MMDDSLRDQLVLELRGAGTAGLPYSYPFYALHRDHSELVVRGVDGRYYAPEHAPRKEGA